MMKKLIMLGFLLGVFSSANAMTIFTGSLYMYDSAGTPIMNTACASCNSSIGEIDMNLYSEIADTGNTATDIIGNHGFVDESFNWAMTGMSWGSDPITGGLFVTGTFEWTNLNGVTMSSFYQEFTLDAYGEITALDSDLDGIAGQALIDGPFVGHTIYLEGQLTYVEPVPVPAAVWLFGSGLIGLVGLARRKRD